MIATRSSTAIALRLLKALGFGLALFLVFLIAANLLFSAFYSNRILPGVSMSGIPLEGLTVDQAAAVIGKTITFPDQGVVLLQAGDKSWSVSPAQLGLS